MRLHGRLPEGSLVTLGSLISAASVLERSRASATTGSTQSLPKVADAVNILSGAKRSPSIFSASHADPNAMKIKLMERLGKAFGLSLRDFAEPGDMARAIRQAMSKMTPDGIRAIEKAVGLDRLDMSLNEMLDAMSNPGGGADRKLDAALRNPTGALADDDAKQDDIRHGLGLDEIGRYSLHQSKQPAEK